MRIVLTRVAVENFKSFAHRQEARLSKITLIYGPNSAGKSSIIQGLLLLKQTMDKAGEYSPAELVTRGPNVDVGSFLGIVHAHDIKNVLSLEVRHDRSPLLTRGDEQVRLRETGLRASFAWDPEARTAIHCATTIFSDNDELHFELRTDLESDSAVVSLKWLPMPILEIKDHRLPPGLLYAVDNLIPVGLVLGGLTKDEWESRESRWEENRRNSPPRLQTTETDDDVYAFDPIFEEHEERLRERLRQVQSDYHDPLDWFPWFNRYIDKHAFPKSESENDFVGALNWHNVLHIGPVRHLPDRFEALSRSYSHDVGHQGEYTVQLLTNDRELLEIVNHWLKRLGIRYVLEALPIHSDYIGDIIAMSLLHRDSNIRHSFKDVGYGISQVIPIVAQCFAFENVTLCIEQPELHIHPRLQAELGDLFIAATLDLVENDSEFESGRGVPNNQLIIETHSEHLLLRLQRRIREGVISNEDVSVLYVDTTADGTSTIQTLRLDTDGSFLDEWPGGFFEERFNEIFGA